MIPHFESTSEISSESPYHLMLHETRDLSQRIVERVEELNRLFPTPALAEALRRLHAMAGELPPGA
jgi:hypothetical protein